MLSLLLLYLAVVDGTWFYSKYPYNYDPFYVHETPFSYRGYYSSPYGYIDDFSPRSGNSYKRKPGRIYSGWRSSSPYGPFVNPPRPAYPDFDPSYDSTYTPVYGSEDMPQAPNFNPDNYYPISLEPFEEPYILPNVRPYQFGPPRKYPSHSPFVRPLQSPYDAPFRYPPPPPYPYRPLTSPYRKPRLRPEPPSYQYAQIPPPLRKPQKYSELPSNPLDPLSNPFGRRPPYPYKPILPGQYDQPLPYPTSQHLPNPYQDQNTKPQMTKPSSDNGLNSNKAPDGLTSMDNVPKISSNESVDEVLAPEPPNVPLNKEIGDTPKTDGEKILDKDSNQEPETTTKLEKDTSPKISENNVDEQDIFGKTEDSLQDQIHTKTALIATLIDREHLDFKDNTRSTYQDDNEFLNEAQARNVTSAHISKTITKLMPQINELKALTNDKKNSMNEVAKHFAADHIVPILMTEMFPEDQQNTPLVVDKLGNELSEYAKNKIMHIFGVS